MPPLIAEVFPEALERFVQVTLAHGRGLWYAIQRPDYEHLFWNNYFYWLLILSSFFWALEILRPWRTKQARIRKDFWLDGWYMLFNLFVFPLLGFAGAAAVTEFFTLKLLGAESRAALATVSVADWPAWLQLVVLFVVRDFSHWCVHVLLHRVPWLWEFHKVHHSVEEMGFAAHLRYHWMENLVYRTLEYMPLALLGFAPLNFFAVYLLSLAIGHWNHANLDVDIGPFGYILNNPRMHIWHHAREIPGGRRYGVNFGISLSVWDYLFGTAVIPGDGRDVALGFPELESFPKDFLSQAVYPLVSPRAQRDD